MTSRMTQQTRVQRWLPGLAAVAVVVLAGRMASAQQPIPEYRTNNYSAPYGWSNYYAGTDPSAALYPSPRPTPPFVGHTYITYPVFAPHQYLYTHGHRYVRDNGCGDGSGTGGGGTTTTTVRWGHRWYPLRTQNEEFPFFNLDEAYPR
ncbi:MAG: hypothetical protein KDA63_16455 [Planctomycetales bacterium]|nr:hypothetical protein [Planctomycetales bacterium]